MDAAFGAIRSTADLHAHPPAAIGITHAMWLMNQTSVLGRYLWVFRGIVGKCSMTCSTSTPWTSTS